MVRRCGLSDHRKPFVCANLIAVQLLRPLDSCFSLGVIFVVPDDIGSSVREVVALNEFQAAIRFRLRSNSKALRTLAGAILNILATSAASRPLAKN